jgi:hypothetical protein
MSDEASEHQFRTEHREGKPPGTCDGYAFRDPAEAKQWGYVCEGEDLDAWSNDGSMTPTKMHDFPQLNCGSYRMVQVLLIDVVYGLRLVMSRMQA